MKIAVILTTAGRPQLLEKALLSVANQTRKPNEIIVTYDAAAHVADVKDRFSEVRFVANCRTAGISGGLNEGVLNSNADVVAFLDDDDWWEPTYLEQVESAAQRADLTYAGLVRHEPAACPQKIPRSIQPQDFLVGNPGVQGSNLAVRRETFWRAGGFDEALPSTTDRDLMIRILELPGIQVAPILQHLVHCRVVGHARLSDAGPKKHAGLAGFEAKHRHRMTPVQVQKHRERGAKLFGWDGKRAALPDLLRRHTLATAPTPRSILVGFSSGSGANAQKLLDDLAVWHRHGVPVRNVLVIDHSDEKPASEARGKFAFGVETLVERDVRAAARTGQYGDAVRSYQGGPAFGRTVLQHELYRRWQLGDLVLVLDDDVDLTDLRIAGRRATMGEVPAILGECQAQGDVVVGGIHGAPPLPDGAGTRVSLLDLVHHAQGGSGILEAMVDDHYDWSDHGGEHLETPRPLTKMAGLAVAAHGGFLRDAKPAVPYGHVPTRGGFTLIRDPLALRDYPNMVPIVDGQPTRRGDTLWLHQLKSLGPRRDGAPPYQIHASRISVAQRRSPRGVDWAQIRSDVEGAAATRAVNEVGMPSRSWTNDQVEDFVRSFMAARRRRLAIIKASAHRINGLLDILEQQLPACDTDALGILRRTWDPERVATLEQAEARAAEDLRRFAMEAPSRARSYRKRLPLRAKTLELPAIAAQAGFPDADILGRGQEGLVVSEGDVAHKIFYHGTALLRPEHLEHIRALGAAQTQWFVPVRGMHKTTNGQIVISMPLIRGRRYQGGHGPGIIRILREARRVGLLHTNVCPANLVVGQDGPVLVDPGRSLAAWTPEGERDMAKRLFLTWRFWRRKDLPDIMRRLIGVEDAPELIGFERFLDGIEPRFAEAETHEIIHDLLEDADGTVLDYGCGKGRLAESLVGAGHQVTAWDPADSRYPVQGTATYVTAPPSGEYDVVIVNLVLCQLPDSDAVDVLRKAARHAVDGGRVLLSFCNPVDDATHSNFGTRTRHDYDQHEAGQIELASGKTLPHHHRPLDWYEMVCRRAGLHLEREKFTSGVDLDTFGPMDGHRVWELRRSAGDPAVDLVIKACAQDAPYIREQVRHLTKQLASPRLARVVVATDHNESGFSRPHGTPARGRLLDALHDLQRQGYIDEVLVTTDTTAAEVEWFDAASATGRAANNQPIGCFVTALLHGESPRLVHVDADILLHVSRNNDPVALLELALDQDMEAITATLPIPRNPHDPEPDATNGQYRVETRFGIIDRSRLRASFPLPNHCLEGRWALPWHRALDEVVKAGPATSIRIRTPNASWIHVPNARKHEAALVANVRIRMEAGTVPDAQLSRVDLAGDEHHWLGTTHAAVTFLVRGGRQPASAWHAAASSVVDAMPDAAMVFLVADDKPRARAIVRDLANRFNGVAWAETDRRPPSQNIAFMHAAVPSDGLVAHLDADDLLLPGAAPAIEEGLAKGADALIGGIVRTDKDTRYKIDPKSPRVRGIQPWVHLRVYRRQLWEAAGPKSLRMSDRWMPHTEDWGLMVPILEAAQNPVAFDRATYLYQPGSKKSQRARAEVEEIITFVVGRAVKP